MSGNQPKPCGTIFSDITATKRWPEDENYHPKMQCFRENRLCRERKTQACAKPLHAKSSHRFFFTILACQLQGTIHGGAGDATTSLAPSPDAPVAYRPVSLRHGQRQLRDLLRSRWVEGDALAGAHIGCGGPGGYPDPQGSRMYLICLREHSEPLI